MTVNLQNRHIAQKFYIRGILLNFFPRIKRIPVQFANNIFCAECNFLIRILFGRA